MNPLEEFLRLALYYDMGTSPERLEDSFRTYLRKDRVVGMTTDCDNDDIRESLFRMTAADMLDKYQSDICRKARHLNIDARAIAGAIAWEYEENWKGRISDRWQIHWQSDDMGIGWGSIHTSAAKAIRPGVPEQELVCMRVNAQSALGMVADIMAENARLYFDKSGGIWIHDNPSILAYFFNTGRPKVLESATQRKLTSQDMGQVITLNVNVNPMAKWVAKHLDRFSEFRTKVDPPKGFYAHVRTD